MRILLLNPPAENTISEYPNDSGEGFIEPVDFGCFPPLGLLYVYSYLERYAGGHDLYFNDCVADNISHNGLESVIDSIKPDIVGITSFTISLIDVLIAARTIKRVNESTHICLGGHHPTAFPLEAAKREEFDSIIVGEGEIAFSELVRHIEINKDITKILGVYTSDSIKKCNANTYFDERFLNSVTVPAGYIEDIDSLPFPNRSYIRNIKYQSIVGVSNNLATLISSRGCPYKCTFCDVPYKKYRKRNARYVIDEVEECLQMGYNEIHFYDDLFNISPERVIEICNEIDRRSLVFAWDFRGRVNTVTKQSLQRAKTSGCRMISFGVETGTDEGLSRLRKGTTIHKIQQVFQWCRELGIKTIADFMIGLPTEKNKYDIMNNIGFLIKLNPDYAQFSILNLYPNTEIYREAVEKGLIRDGRWQEFALNPSKAFTVDHWEEYFSMNELVRLQKYAYKKFYWRPSYVIRNITNTMSFHELKMKTKGAMRLLFS